MISIDPKLSKPIFQQIIDNIKENIIKGIIIPGEKIPSVRELSILLETNPNTINKAYKELERQKIIETIQGRGSFIKKDYTPKIDEERYLETFQILKKLIIDFKYMGIEREGFIDIINEIYKKLGGEMND
jgi:GntR family transcriptional regulator